MSVRSTRPDLRLKLPAYSCQPGPSTFSHPHRVSSDSTEPVYYLAEPPASPIYCQPNPPPSPTHMSTTALAVSSHYLSPSASVNPISPSACVVNDLTYLNLTSASTKSATSVTDSAVSDAYLSPSVSVRSTRPDLRLKLPSYSCQPGPSTFSYQHQVSSDSTEPVYYLAEPPARPTSIYCQPHPPPSPTHIYRELDVSGRNRMNKPLKSLWYTALFITAIIVGSLLYVYVPHKGECIYVK